VDVSRWWWAILTTFERNHDWKSLKASCIRHLFHHDRRWVKNHISTFWGDWGKTSGANFQTSGAVTAGSCVMTTIRLTRRSLCGSFWLLQIRRSSLTLLTHRISPPCDFFFLFPKIKLKLKRCRFESTEGIQIASHDAMTTLSRNDFQQCFRS